MDPASLLRELRDGHGSAVRLGLYSLALGAAATMLVIVLLTPTMDGLVGIPGHDLFKPSSPSQATRAPKLTAAQRTTMRRTAVRVVSREVGVHEWPTGDNRGARIVTYRRAVVGYGENPRSPEPWCADFVSWAWKRAGYSIGFGGRGTDYVPELVAWAKLTHRWRGARTGYRPRAGDLVVYNGNGLRHGHVGMVVRVGKGRISTVEGNLSNRVKTNRVKPWDSSVTGFVAPV